MKKKIIGLSILLVALLLSLSTISYANTYRDFTETEIKNVLYKAWLLAGHSETDVINAIDYHDNQGNITTIVNALNNTNNCIISFDTGSSGYNSCYISCYNSLGNTHPYFYNGAISFKNSPSGTMYKIFFNQSFSTASVYYYYNSRTDYIYYGDTFYNSGSGTTVTHAANTYTPSTFFDEWYYEDIAPFSFIPETGLGIVSYNNYDYNLYEAPSSGDLLLGTLNIPNGIVVNYQDIINYYWRWNNWQERSLPSDIIKLRLLSSEEGNLSWAVYLTNDNIYNNTYYQYIWTSTQTEPYQFVSGGCYIKDSHTVIVDGVVDPYLTFSGDYSDEYNNNLELQDIKDTMQDQTDQLLDSSEVDSLLGKFGSSGDILEQFGYSPIENPFVVVIRNVFIGLNDVLLGSGNQTLDLSSFGMELVLHSDDFILPDNIIINFIHLICNGFFVYGLYKYGFQLIQWINTGRLQNLLDETTGHTHYLF